MSHDYEKELRQMAAKMPTIPPDILARMHTDRNKAEAEMYGKPGESLVWYGAGNCQYWTDDFGKLDDTDKTHRIPCCPVCKMVGFQIDKRDWHDKAHEFTVTHPGYYQRLMRQKEQCKRVE